MTKPNNNSANRETKALIVSEVKETIFGDYDFDKLNCRLCDNIIAAMELLAGENFTHLILQIDKINGNIASAITAAKKLRPGIDVILLCTMLDEPMARELICPKPGTEKIALDYHIYPLSYQHFKREILKIVESDYITTTVNSDIEKKLRILERLATEDDLTGLKNRRYLLGFLNYLIQRAEKQNLRITLLIFDIDNFKSYNDLHGHAIGDRVLQQVAKMIHNCIRKQDVVARIGGDEFAVVFWDSPGIRNSSKTDDRRNMNADHPREVFKVTERFRNQIESGSFASLGPKAKGQLSISGGLASYPADGSSIKELFEQSDKALMQAKRQGKNQIYIIGQPKRKSVAR